MTQPEPSAEPKDTYVDLSKQDSEAVPRSVVLYDPRPGHDRVRARITGWLIALVGVLTVGSYLSAITGLRTVDDIAKLHGLVVAPILTMAGGIIGFYFAQHRGPP